MAFDPDQFLSQTSSAPAEAAGFDPDKFLSETDPKSVGGFLKNAATDVGTLGKGMWNLAEKVSSVINPINMAFRPKETGQQAFELAKSIPEGLIQEGKRLGVGTLFTDGPQAALKQFGNAVYDRPVTSLLDFEGAGKLLNLGKAAVTGAGEAAALAPEVGGAAGLGEAAEVAKATAPEAPEVGRMAGAAPNPLEMPGEAADILKKAPEAPPPPPPVTPGNTFQETVANLGKKIPDQVKQPLQQVGDFLQGKYGQAASKPGWNNIVADYMKEHGQNLTLKELGAAPGQIRKIGVDRARDLADYALDNGLAGPKIGTIGREQVLPQRLEDVGGAVGAFRKMAADRGAVVNPDQLIDQIRSQLDNKYLQPGLHSGEKGLYMKALMELKKAGGRADDLADKVSELFQESKNLDRLKRPSGPVADVARAARNVNHGQIASALNPQEMNIYEKALEDYGALTQINEFVKRRGSVEAGGRLGPGSGISRAAVQKFLDSVGYRTQAKIMRNLSEKIRSNPEITARPQNLFRNYVDEAAEAADEMTDVGQ